ncbi:hypothetical protein SI65_08937 [Aspergillus cristatus]|uniref:Uncharacterized protein n=1 Tax=Aspergillus cristatus TaxID=573508 RepID=A0A1E3B429_ASPCR|nr:hypothetical protein SI65_08937 [Aspergillus cristatus]
MPIEFFLSSDVESEPQPERTRNRGRDDDGATFEEHLDRLRGRHPRRSDRNSEVVLRGYQPQANRTSSSRALYDRRHPTSRSREEKKESGHEPPVGGYQLVLSPQNAKDCTVHFEMDIEDDLEVQLEEFSWLKRLGRFGAAREMFQRELAERTAYSLPVLIEHADMQYDQGDYRGFSDLVLGYRRRLAKRDFNAIEQLLFELNEALAETLLGEDPEIRHRSYLGEARALFNVESNIDSIEVQILNRLLRIWALRKGEQRKRRNIRRVVKSTYRPVSKALIAQERFWELKDLIAEITNVDIDDA